ncbi:uncharacterized protein LOC126384333 isoform X2 [Epinephelus moara]|uniref:uncharacterized protein LOC126384333 isoform X2 n=1 Tax=Epinephelus moara TaxID=300413 RepID=UPI00214EF5F0|nr:uncharacterized protein LOC126384333 isoform X2 [Epinephelus moara]
MTDSGDMSTTWEDMETAMEAMEAAESLKRCHIYAKQHHVEDSPSPNVSPQRKAPRRKTEPTNSVLLAAINKLANSQNGCKEKLDSIEKSIEINFKSIQTLSTSVQAAEKKVGELASKVDPLELQIKTLSAENKKLEERVNEMYAYSRRWNLRIPESEGENVKMTVIDLFSRVSPGLADSLQKMVDIAHRLGPRMRKEGQHPPRRIIVRFSYRAHRDQVWADAKNSEVLKQKNVKISEDLTQQVREARAKLWPLVEEARKHNKRAGFSGPFAIIAGLGRGRSRLNKVLRTSLFPATLSSSSWGILRHSQVR